MAAAEQASSRLLSLLKFRLTFGLIRPVPRCSRVPCDCEQAAETAVGKPDLYSADFFKVPARNSKTKIGSSPAGQLAGTSPNCPSAQPHKSVDRWRGNKQQIYLAARLSIVVWRSCSSELPLAGLTIKPSSRFSLAPSNGMQMPATSAKTERRWRLWRRRLYWHSSEAEKRQNGIGLNY